MPHRSPQVSDGLPPSATQQDHPTALTTDLPNKFRFTKTALDKLPPAPHGKRTTYHDTDCKGLRLRVTERGEKSFAFYYRIDGRQYNDTIGSFPATTIEQARRAVADKRTAISHGINPSIAKKQARVTAQAELTLEQAFVRYYEDHLVVNNKSTAQAARNDFDRYLGTVAPGQKKKHGQEKAKSPGAVNWSHRKLSTITQAEVRTMMTRLRKGTGARTANKAMVQLRAIFNKCIEWQLHAGPNPCTKITKYADGEKKRTRYLTKSELTELVTALEHYTIDFQHFVWLALYTGARRENLLAMRWQDILWEQALWIIPGEKSKNGHALTVALPAQAIPLLQQRQKQQSDAPSPYVFPGKGQSGHMTAPKRLWTKLRAETELEVIRIHDLRRTLGSWMINSGSNLDTVGAALGHKTTEATRVYAYLERTTVHQAVQTVADKFAETAANAARSPSAEVV